MTAFGVIWLLLFSANRFGPKISGIIYGIPLIAAISYIILSVEQGTQYASLAASENALGSTISVLSLYFYLWSRHQKWPITISLISCGTIFILSSLILSQIVLSPSLNHIIGFSCLIAFHFFLQSLPTEEIKTGMSSQKEIIFQALLGSLLVSLISLIGNYLPEVIAGKMVALPISALAALIAIEKNSNISGINAFLKATPAAFLLNVFYTFLIWIFYPKIGTLYGTIIAYITITPIILFSVLKK